MNLFLTESICVSVSVHFRHCFELEIRHSLSVAGWQQRLYILDLLVPKGLILLVRITCLVIKIESQETTPLARSNSELEGNLRQKDTRAL